MSGSIKKTGKNEVFRDVRELADDSVPEADSCRRQARKKNVRIGTMNREVSPDDIISVEKKNIISSHDNGGIQYSTNEFFHRILRIELADPDDNVIFERHEHGPETALEINPVFGFDHHPSFLESFDRAVPSP